MQTIKDRFMSKVIIGKDEVKDCWNWSASKARGGYGQFRVLKNGKWTMGRANRISYELFKGELNPALLVCHTCDNPLCVNPNHLFLGTHKENARDMINKGRRKLTRNPKHKFLDRIIVENMRKDYLEGMKQAQIASKYDFSRQQVSRVVTHKIWK